MFAAMNVQFISYKRMDREGRELIFARLRTSLMALKQFEECYILARWVRLLWNDVFDRFGRKSITGHTASVTHATLGFPSTENQSQVPFIEQPSADAEDLDSQRQGIDYGSDWWLGGSPYSSTDWSNLVFSEDYEAIPSLRSTPVNPLDYEGLQFLANMRMMG